MAAFQVITEGKALQDGLAASTKNQRKHAIDDTNKAVDRYPQYATALATRAILERNNHLQQALIDAQRAIEFDPNFGLGYVALGSVYTESGRFDDAVRTLNRAIAIQPDAWSGAYEMFRALVGRGITALPQFNSKEPAISFQRTSLSCIWQRPMF